MKNSEQNLFGVFSCLYFTILKCGKSSYFYNLYKWLKLHILWIPWSAKPKQNNELSYGRKLRELIAYVLLKGCDWIMERPNWGIGGLVFVGCMFLGGGVGSMLGNAQTGWLIGMGIGFLGMALTRLFRK